MMGSAEWRCQAAAIAPGCTEKFRLVCGGRAVEGFVVNHDGRYFAYVNRCAHVGTPLDLWPNEFLSEDGRLIVCATHGAVYDPASGVCLGGPCVGDALDTLPLRQEGEALVVRCAPS